MIHLYKENLKINASTPNDIIRRAMTRHPKIKDKLEKYLTDVKAKKETPKVS